MLSAPVPTNEKERLDALLSYGILDTAPEEAFDEITYLASYVCQKPIALLSLIDATRVWSKAAYGASPSIRKREDSLCAHVVDSNSVFEVRNTHLDDRFKDNPYAKASPGVIYYAGAPIIDPNGFCIGSLCVIDHKSGEISEEQKVALVALARSAMAHIALSKTVRELEQAMTEIKRVSELAILGEMSRKMAHEINNPLAIMRAAMDVLETKGIFSGTNFQDTGKYQKILNENIKRIETIVGDMRRKLDKDEA